MAVCAYDRWVYGIWLACHRILKLESVQKNSWKLFVIAGKGFHHHFIDFFSSSWLLPIKKARPKILLVKQKNAKLSETSLESMSCKLPTFSAQIAVAHNSKFLCKISEMLIPVFCNCYLLLIFFLNLLKKTKFYQQDCNPTVGSRGHTFQ